MATVWNNSSNEPSSLDSSNQWSNLDNSNVWRTETKFNPDVWKASVTKFKLLAVPFDKEHQHVVKFDTDAERDHFFFEELHGYEYNQETGWNFKSLEVFSASLGKHHGDIKVDLPYESAMNYNYLAIEMNMQPVNGQVENRREVFFYFINSLNKLAANNTELFLELDSWMTYINSVKIDQLKLSRGHYLHSKVDAQTFLADPISSSFGLLEHEEELPELKPQVASTTFVSMSKNAPRICVAMTGDLTNRKSWITAVPTETIGNPDGVPVPADATAVDTSLNTTWNKNYFLEGAAPALNEYSSAGPKVSVAQQKLGAGAVEGLRVYSMDPEDFPAFIGWARNNRVGIIKSIQAVYVLDSAVISEGSEFSAFGYTFKEVIQDASPKLLEELQLTEEHFNYSAAASKWAKLYTGQFAKIEISSGDSKAEIAIEEIAKTLSFYARSSSLFPFLKLEALIDGVGGKGLKKYAVKPLKAAEMTTFNSRWSEYTFDLDVPVYSIYVATDQEIGQEELEARKQAAKEAVERKKFDYEAYMMRYSSTNSTIYEALNIKTNALEAQENARRSNINTEFYVSEMQRLSGYDIATTLGADPAYTMTEATALNSKTNSENSNTLAKEISEDSADTAYEIADWNLRSAAAVGTRSAELAYNNSVYQTEIARDQWQNNELPESTEFISWKQNYEEESFIQSWENKKYFYEANRAIWLASQQMQILMTADVAAKGMLGSGLSSIGAASIGPLNSMGSDGVGSASLGAIGGLASGIAEMAIAVEVLDLIWQYQLTQSYVTYGNAEAGHTGDAGYYGGRGDAQYYGPAQKWLEFTNAQSLDEIDFYRGQIVELIEFNTNKAIKEYNSLGDYTLALQIASDTKGVTDLNISTTQSAAIATAGLAKDLSYENARKSYILSNSIVQNDYQTVMDNAILAKDTAYDVADKVSETAQSANLSVQSNALAVLGRDMDIARTNNLLQAAVESLVLRNTLYVDELKNELDYSLARSGNQADYLVRAQSAPAEYGVSTGDAWTDVWGRRGLEIQVIRCTDAVAEQAANLFSRYGYRTPGIFVREPNLKLMTGFTYWEGEDVWLTGDRINETNKQILKDIFTKGVTVWNDTETFFQVSLDDNQLL